MTDPEQPPTEPGQPAWAVEEDEPSTTLVNLRDGAGRWLAGLLALFLVVPAGFWLVDTIAFNRDGAEVADAAPALADAVALVTRLGCNGQTGTGSGFAIEFEGGPALVTNRHVVEGASSVGLRTLAGGPGPQVTEVLLSTLDDVAVLRLSQPLGATLGLASPPSPGDDVRLVGFPGARPITTTGQVDGVEQARVVLDFEVGGGASGAPIVDGDDTVVAQVVARRSDGSGVAIAAPTVADALEQLEPAPDC